MEKNFTQLISSFTQAKKFVIALTSLMILAGSVYLMAAVGITITGSGAISLSADLATTTFTPVGNIAIKEGVANQFEQLNAYKIVITAPEGWIFPNE
jgi:hypothetical protein